MTLIKSNTLKYPKKSHPQTNIKAIANLKHVRHDLTGKIFGRLTVLSFSRSTVRNGSKGTRTYWLCKCDCGKTVEKLADKLLRKGGGFVGCGCPGDYRPYLKETERGFRALYSGYRGAARYAGREFSLSKDDFREMTSAPCFYCGVPPQQVRTVSGLPYTAYLYNGVDRKDNLRGYILGNCLPCCFRCNEMKKDMAYADFVSHIHRISSRLLA